MHKQRLFTLGAAGAIACVGACAAASFIPALLASGGIALFAERFTGWQPALGLALLAAAGIWWLIARRPKQARCACPPRMEGTKP